MGGRMMIGRVRRDDGLVKRGSAWQDVGLPPTNNDDDHEVTSLVDASDEGGPDDVGPLGDEWCEHELLHPTTASIKIDPDDIDS